jgi:predicted dehydrogenase
MCELPFAPGRHDPRVGDRIRVGVVGTGFSAASHLDALARLPSVEVVAIAGSDAERAAGIAAEQGAEQGYGSHLELLDHPGLDAIHNCTINRLHHEINLAALERGLHVLSEKPLALDQSESGELAAAAQRAGVVAAVCFNYRHYPVVAQLRALLASGDYGRPHFVHGAYLQDWLLLVDDWNWRLETIDAGASRAVADIGSHWADLVQHVTGDSIVEVVADLGTLHSTRSRPEGVAGSFESAGGGPGTPVSIETEDFGSILVRFASGARGTFTVSQVSAGRKNELWFEVDTDQAALSWRQMEPNSAWIGRRDGPNLELGRDPRSLAPGAARLTTLPAGHPEGWLDALAGLVRDFYEAVAAQQAGSSHEGELASFQVGHERVCLVDAIVESSRTGSWTRVAGAA